MSKPEHPADIVAADMDTVRGHDLGIIRRQHDLCRDCRGYTEGDRCGGYYACLDHAATQMYGIPMLTKRLCWMPGVSSAELAGRVRRSGLQHLSSTAIPYAEKQLGVCADDLIGCGPSLLVASDYELASSFLKAVVSAELLAGNEARYVYIPAALREWTTLRQDWVMLDAETVVLDRYDVGIAGGFVLQQLGDAVMERVRCGGATVVCVSRLPIVARKPEEVAVIEFLCDGLKAVFADGDSPVT